MANHPFGRRPPMQAPSLEQQAAYAREQAQEAQTKAQIYGGASMQIRDEDICPPKPARGTARIQIVPIERSSGGIVLPSETTTWLLMVESSGVYDRGHGPVEIDIPVGSRLLMRQGFGLNVNWDMPKGCALIDLGDVMGWQPPPADYTARMEGAH